MPWTSGQVDAIRDELPGRYIAMTDTGRYLGLRQGEIFGLDIYGYLMPHDHEASLRQVEAIFAAALRSVPEGPETAEPGREAR